MCVGSGKVLTVLHAGHAVRAVHLRLVDLTGKVQELDARALSRYRKKLRGEMEVGEGEITQNMGDV